MLLQTEMDALKTMMPFSNLLNKSISLTGIDWHLDHSLKVIIGVCTALQNSNPQDYKWSFNLTKLLIFTAKTIPRGKVKAPKSVVATEKIAINLLETEYNDAIELLQNVKNLPEKSNFKHPYFGVLKRNETMTFLKIHTKHHLKIMKEIKA
jgi:hypothetical protein